MIIQGNVLEVKPEGKFHAILTDPPYHLTSITERFGRAVWSFGKLKDI